MTQLEIESSDIIRLVLQFCRENNLSRTLHTLQDEARVTLNCVESIETFLSDVNHGRWDTVLQAVGTMTLPEDVLQDLYEQVVLELLELRESDTARQLLRETAALQSLKLAHPDRFKRMEQLCNRGFFDPKEVYEGMTKEKKRGKIAQSLAEKVQEAPPSRLLAVIGQALKWQQNQGLLPQGTKFDLFRGVAALSKLEKEEITQIIAKAVKFGQKSHPEVALFSPDGQYLVSGSVDGFIEVWDHVHGTIRKDLEYQAQENFMMHEAAVICMAFSRDSEILATGSQDGKIKVWKVATGQCVRRFEKAHDSAVTCMQFSRDSSQLLTGSFDNTVRIHGLKSGKTLKEFRGHTAYVNTVVYSADNNRVVSGASDGKVKVWDARTSDCIYTFSPPPPPHLNSANALPVNAVFLVPKSQDLIYVCTRTSTIYLMTMQGQVLKQFHSGKRDGGDMVAATVSPRGEWIYCAGEDNNLYVFSHSTGKLEHMMKIHDKDVIGLAHHPHLSILTTWGFDGTLNICKSVP